MVRGFRLLNCAISGRQHLRSVLCFGWSSWLNRVPLFAIAATFWLERDQRLLYAMLPATARGLVIVRRINRRDHNRGSEERAYLALWRFGVGYLAKLACRHSQSWWRLGVTCHTIRHSCHCNNVFQLDDRRGWFPHPRLRRYARGACLAAKMAALYGSCCG